MSRELPAHIANLLPADSAGIPWAGRDLSGEGNPLHTFDGDDGFTTPVISEARRRLLAGDTDEPGFVNALAGQRLFAPVLATGHSDAEHGDKEAEISLVTLTASDGRRAMPAFTSVQALTDWHPEARPVAAEAERVMLAALAEVAELVVLDPPSSGGGETPRASRPRAEAAAFTPEEAHLTFVIRRPAVEALAQGSSWTPSYQDHQLAQALADIPQHCPGVSALQLSPGPGILSETRDGSRVLGGGTGPELSIGVVMEPGTDEVGVRLGLAAVQAAAEEISLLRQRADSIQIVQALRTEG
ncbi:SseB family protein [Nesterenkonia muleiensis]|uniref:SseB family protein n=1 Tax=Nesterenkonia muleiensis TaxID=2282648 RepID=UPI000E759A8F|nr:SseB family protein [Nesterenkonia muleiensis]